MNIFNFISSLDLDQKEQEALSKKTNRREAFLNLGTLGKKLAVAAVPFGLASLPAKTFAKTMAGDVIDTLNFALLLEYLEAEYYILGLDSGVITGSTEEKVFMQISKHESQHVDFLKMAISGSGGTPIDKPEFDFTVGGDFDPFDNYQVFLALSQAFEDTGVRAYKGQATNLMGSDTVLTAALQIHSVEARHASQVRRMRGLKGWITQAQRGAGMPAATQAVYDGEDNLIQGGVNVTQVTEVGTDGITEAYDEPLTKDEVVAIASLFLV
ncbi:ferritin-like domain-containing protein [soil metagenome]